MVLAQSQGTDLSGTDKTSITHFIKPSSPNPYPGSGTTQMHAHMYTYTYVRSAPASARAPPTHPTPPWAPFAVPQFFHGHTCASVHSTYQDLGALRLPLGQRPHWHVLSTNQGDIDMTHRKKRNCSFSPPASFNTNQPSQPFHSHCTWLPCRPALWANPAFVCSVCICKHGTCQHLAARHPLPIQSLHLSATSTNVRTTPASTRVLAPYPLGGACILPKTIPTDAST